MTIQHTAFGILTPEHKHPVFNERAVRGAAGLFLMLGVSGWMVAALTDDFSLLRLFGVSFMIDMFIRLFLGQRFSPTLVIADFFVRNQNLEWVDAKPKAASANKNTMHTAHSARTKGPCSCNQPIMKHARAPCQSQCPMRFALVWHPPTPGSDS